MDAISRVVLGTQFSQDCHMEKRKEKNSLLFCTGDYWETKFIPDVDEYINPLE